MFSFYNSVKFKNQKRNSIAYGLEQKEMIQLDILTIIMKGIICSDNNSGEQQIQQLECSSSILNDNHFDNQFYTQYKVRCPKDCQKQENFKVFGNGVYMESSSICRAGLFQSLINNEEGGEMIVQIIQGLKDYIGGDKNGISSQPAEGNSQTRSFILQKMVHQCPKL